MTAYYNEIDPYAAAWLRNLIAAGHIADGVVDERSIVDVQPDDLAGFTQCHFFAGIGVWSYALRLAGWPDDREVWTGSCPCQPFSAAGAAGGFDDERHLWPFWHYLIERRRPRVIFGEQVASKDGLGWLDLVQADLQGSGYASAAFDLCAAGFGAPHIRQRLYFVGDTSSERLEECVSHGAMAGRSIGTCAGEAVERTDVHPVQLANAYQLRLESASRRELHDAQHHPQPRGSAVQLANAHGEHEVTARDAAGLGEPRRRGTLERLADAIGERRSVWDGLASLAHGRSGPGPEDVRRGGTVGLADAQCGESAELAGQWHGPREADSPGSAGGDTGRGEVLEARPACATNGFWREADWLFCRDGKWRPVRSGTFPLAHGAPARVGRLRAYGNAIVAQVAQGVIESYLECKP